MSHLKRKSVDGSSDAGHKTNGDAPSKRMKVDEAPDPNALIDEMDNQDTHIAHKSEGGRDSVPAAQDVFVDDIGAIEGAHQPNKAGAGVEGLPESVRSGSETSMLEDSYRRSLSPREDRRHSNSGRRSPPTRSPETKSHTYQSRRRGHSPLLQPRHQRESEISRKQSDTIVGDRDRQRRESLLNKEEEKKRGRRLFGGLLSTLSQSTTNSQQRKRHEIEKKQQEKAAKQRSEDDERRSRRLQELDRIRKIEQVRFDEQVMRTRHSNMLAMAHSLQTRSRPKLYYRPWELTPDQEETIKEQIRDVQATIEDELQQFRRQKGQRLQDLGALSSVSDLETTSGELVIESEPSGVDAKAEFTAAAANDQRDSPTPSQEPQTNIHEERDHDEIVEADEDTVIY